MTIRNCFVQLFALIITPSQYLCNINNQRLTFLLLRFFYIFKSTSWKHEINQSQTLKIQFRSIFLQWSRITDISDSRLRFFLLLFHKLKLNFIDEAIFSSENTFQLDVCCEKFLDETCCALNSYSIKFYGFIFCFTEEWKK